MSNEYLKISNLEKTYGTKNLLQTQIALINIIKRFKQYEVIRQEELSLKVSLKSKMQELGNSLAFLEKLLPRAPMIKEKEEVPDLFPEHTIEQKKEKDKLLSLEQELDAINQRLSQIH